MINAITDVIVNVITPAVIITLHYDAIIIISNITTSKGTPVKIAIIRGLIKTVTITAIISSSALLKKTALKPL